MEALKRKRTTLRASFTKCLNAFNAALTAFAASSGEVDEQDIQVTFAMLEERAVELESVSGKIMDLIYGDENVPEAEISKEADEIEDYLKKFKVAQFKEQKRRTTVQTKNVSSPGVTITHPIESKKYRLPKIQLRTFSGDLKEWLGFWSLFKKIHVDDNIEDEEKFQYLIQSMVPGTRAAELVNSYPPTAENYVKVIDSLKNRFGQEDLQIEVYVRELLQLVLQNATKLTKVSLSTLYDKIESHLRALDSLGISTDKCAAMLVPLVESSLPEELLRAWQRSGVIQQDESDTTVKAKDRMSRLIKFIENEVKNELRISMAMQGFSLKIDETEKGKRKGQENLWKNLENLSSREVPSAASLVTTKQGCLFCGSKEHYSDHCRKAQSMSNEEVHEIVRKSRACFRCVRLGHDSKTCPVQLKCKNCGRKHVELMCFPPLERKDVLTTPNTSSNITESDNVNAKVEHNYACMGNTPEVFMQTLRVYLRNDDYEMPVRVVLDPGSQHSYLLKSAARSVKYEPIGEQEMNHNVFGGGMFGLKHKQYLVRLQSLDKNFACNFKVLDQELICSKVPTVQKGGWCEELKNLNIVLSDFCASDKTVTVLIGADVYGKLLTGRVEQLECGLTAIETRLGWTIMGKVPFDSENENIGVNAICMYVQESDIKSLWSLDVLGIKDPLDHKTQLQREEETRSEVLKTIKFLTNENRYEVRLPFFENHPPLGDNKLIAEKRLQSTMCKLKKENLFEQYDAVFQEWLNEGIIEIVPEEEEDDWGHYLPHRHVVKKSSTTPVRPVFDASAAAKPSPSLNECLQKGQNLIELVPAILMRFREGKIGVIADIRKAFLQIGINFDDRNFLRFLWCGKNGKIIKLRHCRLVFGLTSSPFMLAIIIHVHLESILHLLSDVSNFGLYNFFRENIEKLKNSFYVDNVATSVESAERLHAFIDDARRAMASAGFDLRGWEFNGDCSSDKETGLLGIRWDKESDVLRLNVELVREIECERVTKRSILPGANRLFDPLGFVCPVTLTPRLLLQETWSKKLGWDDAVDCDIGSRFLKWAEGLCDLGRIEISRCFSVDYFADDAVVSLHTFCDASKLAYAAVSFLRIEREGVVRLSFVQAKSRVTPVKVDMSARHSIPRLELLAATVGLRLSRSIVESLSLKGIEVNFWSDSSTVLAWISRQGNWDTFVYNRVREIREFSQGGQWRHVPGELNPADLPSRGCNVRQLIESRWWDGPEWLSKGPEAWPNSVFEYDETEVSKELRKTPRQGCQVDSPNCLVLIASSVEVSLFERFSSYRKLLLVTACLRRYFFNLRNRENRREGFLNFVDLIEAETSILKTIQAESFVDRTSIQHLDPFEDGKGLVRVKTRILLREDLPNFLYPIILPHNHSVVKLLVREEHVRSNHAGVQITMSRLRERFWILKIRRVVREVIRACVDCRKQDAQPLTEIEPPLPLDRVRDAAVFEVVGVDFTGPVYLKGGRKAWICIFTCAVYRAVHFELICGLGVPEFLMGLRRLIARRGRTKIMFSDNGTNFQGFDNSVNRLDFRKLAAAVAVERIEWKFNPPAAPWWGGFWERLIGVLKRLLRRTLKRACLTYEEMLTVLVDCEATVNSRPITFISDDRDDMVPLTPAHFLQEVTEVGVIDLDKIEECDFNRRYKYRLEVKRELRRRFRSEYLGALTRHKRKVKNDGAVRVGDIVLVGNDSKKRIDWPLGRVHSIDYGKDGRVRLVRVRTAKNKIVRTVIQRLYPLEISCSDDLNFNDGVKDNFEVRSEDFSVDVGKDELNECESDKDELSECERFAPRVTVTRRGRRSVAPQRLMYE